MEPLQDIDETYQIGQQARVVSGKTLFINCHADGYNITYTWNVTLNRGSSLILRPGEKRNRISISNDGKKLTLRSSSQYYNGAYSCICVANDSRLTSKKRYNRASLVTVYGIFDVYHFVNVSYIIARSGCMQGTRVSTGATRNITHHSKILLSGFKGFVVSVSNNALCRRVQAV